MVLQATGWPGLDLEPLDRVSFPRIPCFQSIAVRSVSRIQVRVRKTQQSAIADPTLQPLLRRTLTSLPFLCPIELLVGLLPNTPGLFIWETHCDTEHPVHDVPGAVARGLCGLNNAAVTVPPGLLQEQLVVGDGSFRMVWWASLSSCVLKNHFFLSFLQGRTCMRASGLVTEVLLEGWIQGRLWCQERFRISRPRFSFASSGGRP